VHGCEFFYGSDAIHRLAGLESRRGVFNRINRLMFKHQKVAKVLYPWMRTIRNLLLKSLGVKRINNLNVEGNNKF